MYGTFNTTNYLCYTKAMTIEQLQKAFVFREQSDTPLYQQLADFFRQAILSGQMNTGEQMVPEVAICDAYSVSRSTVRKTMDLLIEDGLISRRRGRGSFVSSQKLRRPISYLYHFSENVRSIGAKPSSKVLRSHIMSADEELAQRFSIEVNQEVFCLERIRMANEVPLLHEITYVPYALCEGIEQHDFEQESLYEVLEQVYGIHPYHAQESIDAILMNKTQMKLLGGQGIGFRIARVSEMESGIVFEYTQSITRADRCQFQTDLYQKAKLPTSIVRKVSW